MALTKVNSILVDGAINTDASGNVGIGTASPQDTLDITRASGTAAIRIASQGAGSLTWRIASQITGVSNTGFAIRDDTNSANRLTIDGSGNLGFNSGFGSAGIAYGCRAWVNFNAQGTPSIRASGNVTSVIKGSTGNYTINFTNAMPNTNYAVVGGKSNISATHVLPGINVYADTVSSAIMQVYESTGTFQDSSQNFVAVFR